MFLQDFYLCLILALCALFIDYRISVGLIVGFVFSIFNYKFIEFRYQNLTANKAIIYFGSFVGIMILGFPLLLSVLIPNLMSWIGVFIGLMINRTRIIIEAFIKK